MSADREYPQLVADRLRSALDEIELGIVLLDSDLRLTFVNRAFLRIYHLADKSSVSGLDFEGLMRFVVRQRRFLSPARFNAYVKKRANEVRPESRTRAISDGRRQVIQWCKHYPPAVRIVYAGDRSGATGRQAQGNGGGRRHDQVFNRRRSYRSPK
jgi:PAS domain-containing protein